MPNLARPVEIVRDNANVPHIFGATDAEVFFGLGFAHAQDRLWQMTTMRRTAQGRLSEVFGAATLEIDQLLRRFDIYTLSVASFEALDATTQDALRAYAAGVNARLRSDQFGCVGARRAGDVPLQRADGAVAAGRQHRDGQADGPAALGSPRRRGAARAHLSGAARCGAVARHPARCAG